jgi:hypothetical protein
MREVYCANCNELFTTIYNAQKYCSKECSLIPARKWMRKYRQRQEVKIKEKEYNKKYKKEYRKQLRIYNKRYYWGHREIEQEKTKKWKFQNREYYLQQKRDYMNKYRQRAEYRHNINEYQKTYNREKRKNDIQFYIKCNLRLALWRTFRVYNSRKQFHSKEYGIDWKACCQKLIEEKPADFNERNYEIDHIKPLHSFDLTDIKQIKLAFAPENLQWLTAKENRSKQDKWEREVIK